MSEVSPLLPAAPVDFNALHDALSKGKSSEEALAAAVADSIEGDAFEGFAMSETGNGWYDITGRGLEEPVKVQGEAKARARMAELAAAGAAPTPPAPAPADTDEDAAA